MDEILEKFDNTLKAGKENESFKTLYKNWGKFGNQEQRRSEILKQQKSDRRQKLDNCRGILSLLQSAQERDGIFRTSCEYRPKVYVPGFARKSYYLDNILMHSEWLIEKPEDFSTNWYVTPCPIGVRMLVVAGNGITKCYTKYGQFRFEVQTLLPGGNYQERKKNCSVLDCFYFSDTNTMYVLDILSWNNHIMADGEMEFRHFWLQTKFSENPGLDKLTKRNRLSFQLLPMVPCDKESLEKFMNAYPPFSSAKLDGLLFYHKQAHYVPGVTPLVGWLFPFMVPEVLGSDISIHESYAAGKPADYVDQATYILKFEEKMSKKKPFTRGKKSWRTRSSSQNSSAESTMELEECPTGNTGSVDDQISTHDNDKTTSTYAKTSTRTGQNGAPLKSWRQRSNSKISSAETTMESEECPVKNTGRVNWRVCTHDNEETTSTYAKTSTRTGQNGAPLKSWRQRSNSKISSAETTMESEECPAENTGSVEQRICTHDNDDTTSMYAATSTGTAQNGAPQKMKETTQELKIETIMDSEECNTVQHVSEIESEIKSACAQINNDTKEETASMEAETQVQAEENGANQVPQFFRNYYGTSIFSSPGDNEQPPITSFYSLF